MKMTAKKFEMSKKDKEADRRHGKPEGHPMDRKQDRRDGKPMMKKKCK